MSKRKAMEGIILNAKNTLKGYWMHGGRQYFVSPYMVVSLLEEYADTEKFEEREEMKSVYNMLTCDNKTEYRLPALKELKEIKKQLKAENKKVYKPTCEHWFCDIELLIQIMEIISVKNADAYIYIPNTFKEVCYIYCEGNCAALLPIYVPDETELKRREEEAEQRRKEREEEWKKRTEAMDVVVKSIKEGFEATVKDAEEKILHNEKLVNANIDTPEGNETTIVLYLMKKYGVEVPLKTQGWINKALANIEYKEDREEYTYSYYTSSRNSTVFHAYLLQLVGKIKEAHGSISDAEKSKIAENKALAERTEIVEKSILPISFKKVDNRTMRVSKEAELFWKGSRAGNKVKLTKEKKIELYYRLLKSLKVCDASHIGRMVNTEMSNDLIIGNDYSVQKANGNTYIKVEAVSIDKYIIYRFTKGYYNKKDSYVAYEVMEVNQAEKHWKIIDNYSEEILPELYNNKADAEAVLQILIDYKRSAEPQQNYDYDIDFVENESTWDDLYALPFC